MALKASTLEAVEVARDAVNDFYEKRIAEIDRECRNLREYGAPITDLGDQTTEAGAAEAVSILARVGVSVG